LRGSQIQTQHKQKIHSQIDEIEISSDIELEWDNIKNIINDTANQMVGAKMNQRNANWYNEECKEAVKARNEARCRCLARDTRANRIKHEQKRKLAGKICRKKKRKIIKR
jgi:hypothetical protein